MELITSKDNKTVKTARSLTTKKYRRKLGLFVAEGLRTVVDLLLTGMVKTVLLRSESPTAIQLTAALQDVAEQAEQAGCQVMAVAPAVYATLEGTVNGQGVIALVAFQALQLADFKGNGDLYVLVDSVQDPGNLGTLIRTAVAAGVNGLFLTKGSVDPYNDKTVRSTMSALTKIPIYENVTVAEMAPIIAAKGLSAYGTTPPSDETELYRNVTYAGPVILFLGNEANGLSDEWLALCQKRITIPMFGPMESLNLAVAGALCIYAAREGLQEGLL